MTIRSIAVAGAVLAASVTVLSVPSAQAAGPRISNPGTIRALNPQPLPPRWTNPLVLRGLNPQPLPPRTVGSFRR